MIESIAENEINALLLEDYISDAELIKHYLLEAFPKCRITHVKTGKEFIESISNQNPDIVLSDYNLPDYTASEAYEEIKKISTEIPFIIVSGDIKESQAENLINEGIDDYLLKSSLTRIGLAVNKALQRKKSTVEINNFQLRLEEREAYINDIFAHSGISICEFQIPIESEIKLNFFSKTQPSLKTIKSFLGSLNILTVNDNLLDLLEYQNKTHFEVNLEKVFNDENLLKLANIIFETKIGRATNNQHITLLSSQKQARHVNLNLIKRQEGKHLHLLLSFVDQTAQRESELRTTKLLERMDKTISDRTTELSKANLLLHKQTIEAEEINKKLEYNFSQTTDSIQVAKKIQQLMLPKKEKLKKNFKDAFVFYKAKDIVSGDFYWMYEGENEIWMASADCTGHGVPGALMSMTGSHLLSEIISQNEELQPHEILEKLDEQLVERLNLRAEGNQVRTGMDISLCKYYPSTKKLYFSGALQEIFLKRNNEITITKGTRRGIGGIYDYHNIPFKTEIIQLQSGDKIYMTSDGYIDQFGGPKGKKLMKKGFVNVLLSLNGETMFEEYKQVKKVFFDWKKKEEQVDDIIVLGLEI